jgi:hypothetical protein
MAGKTRLQGVDAASEMKRLFLAAPGRSLRTEADIFDRNAQEARSPLSSKTVQALAMGPGPLNT